MGLNFIFNWKDDTSNDCLRSKMKVIRNMMIAFLWLKGLKKDETKLSMINALFDDVIEKKIANHVQTLW